MPLSQESHSLITDYMIQTKKQAKPKIRGVKKIVTNEEVLKRLAALNINITSERILQIYAKQGLMPTPERKSAGRGRGRISDHHNDAPAEVYASWKMVHTNWKVPREITAKIRALALKIENDPSSYPDEWCYKNWTVYKLALVWLEDKQKALKSIPFDEKEVAKIKSGFSPWQWIFENKNTKAPE